MQREIERGPVIATGEAGGRRPRPGSVRPPETPRQPPRIGDCPIEVTSTFLCTHGGGSTTDEEIRGKVGEAAEDWSRGLGHKVELDTRIRGVAMRALEAGALATAAMQTEGAWLRQGHTGQRWDSAQIVYGWTQDDPEEDVFGIVPKRIRGKPYLRSQVLIEVKGGPERDDARQSLCMSLLDVVKTEQARLGELAGEEARDAGTEQWREAVREQSLILLHWCLLYLATAEAMGAEEDEPWQGAAIEVRRVGGEGEWMERDLFPDLDVDALVRGKDDRPETMMGPVEGRYRKPPKEKGKKLEAWIRQTVRRAAKKTDYLALDPRWQKTETGRKLTAALKEHGCRVVEGIDPDGPPLAGICPECGWEDLVREARCCTRCLSSWDPVGGRTILLCEAAEDWLKLRATQDEDMTLEEWREGLGEEIAREGGAPWRIEDETLLESIKAENSGSMGGREGW